MLSYQGGIEIMREDLLLLCIVTIPTFHRKGFSICEWFFHGCNLSDLRKIFTFNIIICNVLLKYTLTDSKKALFSNSKLESSGRSLLSSDIMILPSKITVSVLWNKRAPKWAVVNFGKSMIIPLYIRIPFNLNSLTSGKIEEPVKLNVVNEGRSWYYQREMKIPSSWIDLNFWNTTLSPLISKILSFGSPLIYTVKQKLLCKTKFLV